MCRSLDGPHILEQEGDLFKGLQATDPVPILDPVAAGRPPPPAATWLAVATAGSQRCLLGAPAHHPPPTTLPKLLPPHTNPT